MDLLNLLNFTAVGAALMVVYMQKVVVINNTEITLKQSNINLFSFMAIALIIALPSTLPIINQLIDTGDSFYFTQIFLKLSFIPLLALYFSKLKEMNRNNILVLIFFLYLLDGGTSTFYLIFKQLLSCLI